MVKKIKDLVIEECSLVDRPANIGAVVTLFKSLEPDQAELLRIRLELLRATLAPVLDDDVIGDAAVEVDEVVLKLLDLLGGQPDPAPSGGVGKVTKESETMTTLIEVAKRQPHRHGVMKAFNHTADHIDEVLKGYLAELAPHLSYGEALTRHWSEPTVKALYKLQREAKPARQVGSVAKVQPGDAIWDEIVKRAEEERLAGGLKETKAAAIDRIMAADRDLYKRYRQEQARR